MGHPVLARHCFQNWQRDSKSEAICSSGERMKVIMYNEILILEHKIKQRGGEIMREQYFKARV